MQKSITFPHNNNKHLENETENRMLFTTTKVYKAFRKSL